METKTGHITFDNTPLSVKTKLAVTIAEERSKIMRKESVEEYRESQKNISDIRIIPARVLCQPRVYREVPCEWVIRRKYLKEERVILYFHGGSWMFGSMESARPAGVQLADATYFRCLMVDYRLAPEHPYPAGLEDCYTIYTHLLEEGLDPSKLGIFGDSAGGNLALALLQRLKSEGKPLPAAVALASPVTDMRDSSHLAESEDDLIYTQCRGEEHTIFDLYLGEGKQDLKEQPTLSPITGDWAEMPPLLIHAGGDEPIATDNLAFAQKYIEDGSPIDIKIWNGLFHDFTIVGKTLSESVESMEEIGLFFKEHLGQ